MQLKTKQIKQRLLNQWELMGFYELKNNEDVLQRERNRESPLHNI